MPEQQIDIEAEAALAVGVVRHGMTGVAWKTWDDALVRLYDLPDLPLLPHEALVILQRVLLDGAATHTGTLDAAIREDDHIEHALTHLASLAWEDTEDHLAHAAARLVLALAQRARRLEVVRLEAGGSGEA